jgi:2-C-methyl-D-erythritol 4-phosphate cytidylyltransferase
MSMSEGTAAIVVAGGSGERFGEPEGKQLAEVAGQPVLAWSLRALEDAGVDLIVVVCHPDRVEEYRASAVDPIGLRVPVLFARGGDSRQESVAAGLAVLPDEVHVVVVHDGARPCVRAETIRGALGKLRTTPEADGVIVAHPSVDTLKVVERGRIVGTADRLRIWAAQTPQVFRSLSLRAAHDAALKEGFVGTDDSSLVERWGGLVMVFEGPRDNIKITVPEDRAYVEAVLTRASKEE